MFPTDPAIGADVSQLETIGVFQRRDPLGHRAQGWSVTGGRSFQVERFMGAQLIELLAEGIELALLSRRTRRIGR